MQFFQERRKSLLNVAFTVLIVIPVLLLLPKYLQGPHVSSLIIGTAPDGNWSASTWARSNNSMVGTSANTMSNIWFTGSNGIVTSVFFPSPDIPNSTALEFLVGDSAHHWVDEEQFDTQAHTTLYDPHALAWMTTNTAKNKRYQIKKIIYTDPLNDSLIQQTTFTALKGTLANYLLYVYYNPSIHNSGDKNNSSNVTYSDTNMLVSTDASNSYASALAASIPYQQTSSGFVNFNDGLTDLKGHANCGSDRCPDYTMNYAYHSALRGNTSQVGLLDLTDNGEMNITTATSITFNVVLSFGQYIGTTSATTSAAQALTASLSDPSNTLKSYVSQWNRFDASLKRPPAIGATPTLQQARQQEYYLATNVLKASQDKQSGAFVAGLGNPWGESQGDDDTGGYHLVWQRDVYQIASALIVAGDSADASRALLWSFDTQQQRSGRFPQNSDVNGDPHLTGIQMDEQAFPIMLAWKLGLTDNLTYTHHIRAVANYILAYGPATALDRWGENGGYSPSSIADGISALLCAADIARMNNDPASQTRYTDAADTYQQNLIKWTYTTTGPFGNGHYFERIDRNGNPNATAPIALANHGGIYDERAIVDTSFLELVRQGVLSANTPEITSSLDIVDATLGESVNSNSYWFRYNHDAYGEHNDGSNYDGSGRGRLWPLLSGERGVYAIAAGKDAQTYLTAMMAAANSSGMIPEQIWDNQASASYTAGTPTKSMNPYNWAMAEYITLLFSASEHSIADVIPLTYQRYAAHPPSPDGSSTSATH